MVPAPAPTTSPAVTGPVRSSRSSSRQTAAAVASSEPLPGAANAGSPGTAVPPRRRPSTSPGRRRSVPTGRCTSPTRSTIGSGGSIPPGRSRRWRARVRPPTPATEDRRRRQPCTGPTASTSIRAGSASTSPTPPTTGSGGSTSPPGSSPPSPAAAPPVGAVTAGRPPPPGSRTRKRSTPRRRATSTSPTPATSGSAVSRARGTIVDCRRDRGPGYAGDGGPATAAQFDGPRGLAGDGAGNLYVADDNNHRIRRIDPSGVVTTVAGTGVPEFVRRRRAGPIGAARPPPGRGGGRPGQPVHRRQHERTASGCLIPAASSRPWPGAAGHGYGGDGGPATVARLFEPRGVAVDSAGRLFVADTYNDRIRRVDEPRPGIALLHAVA